VRKVIRDGKVAVLVSPGFGAGWWTWNREKPEMLFSPEIIELIERDASYTEIVEKGRQLFGDAYLGGANDLIIEWVPEGARFDIAEYDGSEELHYLTPDDGFIA
jgi:hypothetical protein